jgi:hypothetical protein
MKPEESTGINYVGQRRLGTPWTHETALRRQNDRLVRLSHSLIALIVFMVCLAELERLVSTKLNGRQVRDSCGMSPVP